MGNEYDSYEAASAHPPSMLELGRVLPRVELAEAPKTFIADAEWYRRLSGTTLTGESLRRLSHGSYQEQQSLGGEFETLESW